MAGVIATAGRACAGIPAVTAAVSIRAICLVSHAARWGRGRMNDPGLDFPYPRMISEVVGEEVGEMPQAEEADVGVVLKAEFLQDPHAVGADRFRAESQLAGDGVARPSDADPDEYIEFAARERFAMDPAIPCD